MVAKSKALIVVNKYWECDPVCWVMTNRYLNDTCGVNLPWPKQVNYPSYGFARAQQSPVPRLVFAEKSLQVEVWCISDLLSIFPDTPNFQSSSQRKMEVLSKIFTYSTLPASLVVAVGTASSGPFCPTYNNDTQSNINGSVVVGSNVFVHSGNADNPDSRWNWEYFDCLMGSSCSGISLDVGSLETALLWPPTNPATNKPHIYVSGDYVAIGDVNVTNYADYQKKDKEAGDSFTARCPGNKNGVSVETTHGLIYATAHDYWQRNKLAPSSALTPFLFVSGVVDRYTMFNVDVTNVYAQNVAGAHNAGVVVARLVADFLSKQ